MRLDGGLERGRVGGAPAPAVVARDDRHARAAEHRGVVDRGDRGPGVAHAAVVLEPQRQDRHLPGDAGDADAVVADGADDSRHVRAVAETVLGRVVHVDEIPASHVIDVAVCVVVHAVAGDFAWIRPDVSREVGVGEIDPRIDDGDDDVPRPGRDLPGLGGVDVGIDPAAVLADVGEAPLRREARVIRNGGRPKLDLRVERRQSRDAGRPCQHAVPRPPGGREREKTVAEVCRRPVAGESSGRNRRQPHVRPPHPLVHHRRHAAAVPLDDLGRVRRQSRRGKPVRGKRDPSLETLRSADTPTPTHPPIHGPRPPCQPRGRDRASPSPRRKFFSSKASFARRPSKSTQPA